MVGPRSAAYAEESAEVEVLFANMEKLKGLTKKIQASMTRLEVSGRNVQEAIGPIYGSTQRLQTVNTNIDRVHSAIAHIRQPLDLKAREDRIIHAGIGKVGLSEFLGSLKRITTALSELKSTNLRANQQAISELNSLLKSGSQQLESLFRDLVNEDARPVEPLHYLTKKLPFPVFEQDKISRLALINSYVETSAQSHGTAVPTAQIFADIRGPYLNSSLQNLAAASVNTARKRAHDAIYQQGTSGIGTYAESLEAMYLAEYEIITPVFSREEWGRVLNLTCRDSLAEFSRTLQELNSHIRNNLTTDCFLAYEIIDIVTKLAFRLDHSTGELKGPLSDALKHIRETAKASLYELLNDTRRRIQNHGALPPDGSALPTTTEVMTRLQTMTAYLPALSSILTALGDGNWTSPPSSSAAKGVPISTLDVGADGRQLLAHYVLDTVDTLLASLEERAKALLKGRVLQGVFVSNNLAVIERMIRSSDLHSLLSTSSARMEAWQKKGTNLYLDAWKEVSLYLLDVQYTSRAGRPTSGSGGVDSAAVVKALNSKDKDAIKDKFRNFNSTFDELLTRHKTLAIDRDIKPLLIREVQRYIEPLYARFWDRYHELDRGRGKYVRYDKMALSAVLSGL
ncbi:hypothetical protein L228DRAFT_260237 [Xylona heveae TC161]|uniref:Exocyst complex protein EXO70 n=1 Tax=Xylona heveae (strain CBS 132557 / TC161) TaxID=1328760 RepID=A0A165HEW1_XYLHT|nr:hypothetical protein L228DRAFT_260237 [Xylona heveae TC161]KZF23406.1 hypothetical protein L228DRAFT_260237 [Xylona heveae TC161]